MASPLIPPAVSAVCHFTSFLTTLSFFPQNLKILRSGDTSAIYLHMYGWSQLTRAYLCSVARPSDVSHVVAGPGYWGYGLTRRCSRRGFGNGTDRICH